MEKMISCPVRHSGIRQAAGLILICMLLCLDFILCLQTGKQKSAAGDRAELSFNWEKIVSDLGCVIRDHQEKPRNTERPKLSLHARAAVLMDADTGRVLWGKNQNLELPMASTTKIMTCMIALEYGKLDDEVTVSSYAASQPEVRLGIKRGEKYRLIDLLYATMLTSYNDCAAAVAEHIGGSVEEFARLMNRKAKDLGCNSTWYITPNGLDAENEGGVHRTSAKDLAEVLSYAVRNEQFLMITQTQHYSFSDCSGKRKFTAVNKNAFLSMMDGAISGKTGFTADAGYCYAGALRRDGKTYTVALLGCGWPPNKSWKWSDLRILMEYGLNHYNLKEVGFPDLVTRVRIPVDGGISNSADVLLNWSSGFFLAGEEETISAVCRAPERIEAPLLKGTVIGGICLYLGNDPVLLIPAVLDEEVKAFTFRYCVEHIFAGVFDI